MGDAFSQRLRTMIDDYIAKNAIDAPPPEHDEGDTPDPTAECADRRKSLDLTEEGITSVIWTTGFTGNFYWLPPDALDDHAMPIQTEGVSPMSGLFYVGFPWLRKRDSGIINGSQTDAPVIADAVKIFLGE
jgi:putative flavoprotein involved in K+ transport